MSANPTEDQLNQWQMDFNNLDEKKKGKITIKSLKILLNNLGLDVSDPKIKELDAKHPDYDADTIDFENFVYLAKTLLPKPTEENLLFAFRKLDRNRDDQLSLSDLKTVLTQFTELSTEQKEEILNITGLKNRRLEFRDFYKMFQSEENLIPLKKS